MDIFSNPNNNPLDAFSAISLCTSVIIAFTGITFLLIKSRPSAQNVSLHRLVYSAKNITKAVVLMPIGCVGLVMIAWSIFCNGFELPLFWMRALGTLYASTDCAGILLMGPRLPMTTLVHHLAVMTIGMANLILNFNHSGVWVSWVFFAVLSSCAWSTNVTLGIRHFADAKSVQKWALFSRKIYRVCIVANVVLQTFFIIYFLIVDGIDVKIVLTFVMQCVIFMDDLYLLFWLKKESSKQVN